MLTVNYSGDLCFQVAIMPIMPGESVLECIQKNAVRMLGAHGMWQWSEFQMRHSII